MRTPSCPSSSIATPRPSAARSLSARASLGSGPPAALFSVSELSEVRGGVGSFRELERVGGADCRGGSAGSLDEVTWKRPTSWGFPSAGGEGGWKKLAEYKEMYWR